MYLISEHCNCFIIAYCTLLFLISIIGLQKYLRCDKPQHWGCTLKDHICRPTELGSFIQNKIIHMYMGIIFLNKSISDILILTITFYKYYLKFLAFNILLFMNGDWFFGTVLILDWYKCVSKSYLRSTDLVWLTEFISSKHYHKIQKVVKCKNTLHFIWIALKKIQSKQFVVYWSMLFKK